jgi:thiamine pyrophosphate-dependent acetolactate synthase large subunit-like protein
MAESFSVPAKRVMHKADLRGAIREMLDTPGPYLLDVMVPHIEHVLPMVRRGARARGGGGAELHQAMAVACGRGGIALVVCWRWRSTA